MNKAFCVAAIFGVLQGIAAAQTCQSVSVNAKSVALPSPRSGAVVNFSTTGQLDPVALLETDITVLNLVSPTSCVMVTFSAQADPSDNYAIYQASIDDVPMQGHGTLAPEYGFKTPIVFDATNQVSTLPYGSSFQNTSNSRMVSYTFFASVPNGQHKVRIRLGSCCNNGPIGGTTVRAATMVVRW